MLQFQSAPGYQIRGKSFLASSICSLQSRERGVQPMSVDVRKTESPRPQPLLNQMLEYENSLHNFKLHMDLLFGETSS